MTWRTCTHRCLGATPSVSESAGWGWGQEVLTISQEMGVPPIPEPHLRTTDVKKCPLLFITSSLQTLEPTQSAGHFSLEKIPAWCYACATLLHLRSLRTSIWTLSNRENTNQITDMHQLLIKKMVKWLLPACSPKTAPNPKPHGSWENAQRWLLAN